LLNGFFNSLIILVILIFHQDIRSALSRVGRNPFAQTITTIEESKLIDEVVKASAALSRTKTGGLIIFEREAKLVDPAETAIKIDARFSRDLVQSIAHTSSPIHDGAILLRNGRLSHASVFLPLSTNPRLGRHLGTRHRAAIGITEETDAVVIVVSEETGKISLAMEGKITRDLEPEILKQILQNTLGRAQGPSMRRLFKSRSKSRVAPAQPSRQARETPPTAVKDSGTASIRAQNKHEMKTLTGLPARAAKDKDKVIN
jgi:diadenylate cyclase